MSRYNGSQSGGSNDNDNDYDDDVTLKIKEYSTVRLTPTTANGFVHDQYGASFITNYDDAEILDGIVLARDDKPDTWNVYSADKFFHLNPEDGLVYENYDEASDEYSGQMSAQDILEHPRVAGHSTTGGSTDYYFTPVGVVIEEAGDIAVNPDVDVETSSEPTIEVGKASTLLSNNSWVRTYAKKMTEEGDAIVNDNGEAPTDRGEPDDNPKYNSHEWMTTEDPSLRSSLEGRSLELWVTRESNTFDDGEETTYMVPNLMDVKTGNFVTIDNGIENPDDDAGSSDTEKAAATDGGTMTQSVSESTDTESTESPDSPSASSGGLPEDVPDKLDDLLDYMAQNADDGQVEASAVRSFAEDEVENADDIDWEAAAAEATQRAE